MKRGAIKFGRALLLLLAIAVTVVVGVYVIFGLLNFFKHSGDIVTNDTVIEMLTLMLAVVGATNYFFYEVTRHHLFHSILDKVRKASSDERCAAKIETKLALSYVMWALFRETRKESYLNLAITGADYGVKLTKEIDPEIHANLIMNIENTLGYLLADKQNFREGRGEETDPIEKAQALKISEKIWQLLEDGEIDKVLRNNPRYKIEETYAWITFVFAESEEDREKAQTIVKRCIKSAPLEWAEEKRKQFKMPDQKDQSSSSSSS